MLETRQNGYFHGYISDLRPQAPSISEEKYINQHCTQASRECLQGRYGQGLLCCGRLGRSNNAGVVLFATKIRHINDIAKRYNPLHQFAYLLI